LHTNDVHAHIEGFDSYGSACDETSGAQQCFGGVARRATQIAEALAQRDNVLLVDAGDQFQGTLYYTYFKQEVIEAFMARLGYDVMTLGNHEFDAGPAELGDFLREVPFPVVCSNLDVSKEPLLAGLVAPYLVREIEGEKVGFVGYITEDTSFLSSPGPAVVFLPRAPAVQAAIGELQARGVNKIIALSHCGYNCDQEMAGTVDGLDVIVGGHTHTLLSDTDPAAAGPYPTLVASPRGEPVLVVTAAQWGKYLGRLEVNFNEAGVVDTWQGAPILLDDRVAQDPEVLAMVGEYRGKLDSFADRLAGETLVDLDGSARSCRFRECNLGDLIADMMLWKLRDQGVEIAMVNAGAIRSSVRAGMITVGQANEISPFGNALATMTLRGADLRAALEHSVSRADDPGNDGTGRFLQVAGIQFTWRPDRPVGARISSVKVDREDGSSAPLEDDTMYTVVCPDYLRRGGDGYTVFRDKAVDPYDYGPLLVDVIMEYLGTMPPVSPTVEGRITRVGA